MESFQVYSILVNAFNYTFSSGDNETKATPFDSVFSETASEMGILTQGYFTVFTHPENQTIVLFLIQT